LRDRFHVALPNLIEHVGESFQGIKREFLSDFWFGGILLSGRYFICPNGIARQHQSRECEGETFE
jgi:hypothetical protein